MTQFHRFTLTFAALVAIAVGMYGCGASTAPPPGAPDEAATPTVKQGEETADTQATDVEATEVEDVDVEVADEPAAADDEPQAATETTEPAAESKEPETKTAAADGEWGTLTGRIVYDGKAPEPQKIDTSKDPNCKTDISTENLLVGPDGGLANAVIMLRTKNVKVNPEYDEAADDEVTLDNKNCRFEPHVQVVRLSQTLMLKNSDPTGHNSNLSPLLNTAINPVLAAGGEAVPYKFSTEEAVPVKVGCNIHPWMGAYIVARKDPYAAVTDKDGNFTIKDLPAGKELEFRLWQESAGYLKNATFKGGKADTRGTFKVKIKPGENDLGDIKVPSSIFKK
jgi:hypothetical protein